MTFLKNVGISQQAPIPNDSNPSFRLYVRIYICKCVRIHRHICRKIKSHLSNGNPAFEEIFLLANSHFSLSYRRWVTHAPACSAAAPTLSPRDSVCRPACLHSFCISPHILLLPSAPFGDPRKGKVSLYP